jgi:hypothetical protein
MDLLNTAFQEDDMIGILEGIENSITPEMPQHFARWGGNMSQWQANVQKIKTFIQDRNAFLPEGLNSCYNLTGPYDVTLEVEPAGSGQIKLNSITIDNGAYPWTGSYHGGIDILVQGIQSNQGFVFDHWEINNHTIPDTSLINITLSLTQSDTIKAVFVSNGTNDIVINEINYKDAIDFQTKDWIELYNNTSEAIDISNWVFKDNDDLHEFIIPNGTVMNPDTYLVLAQTLADFQALYPSVSPVLGDFTFGLSGGGELIRLFDSTGALVDFVEYDDIAPWPTEPDGNGPTLELINPNLDNALASSWHASISPQAPNGTPGAINSSAVVAVEDLDLSKLSIVLYPNPMEDEAIIRLNGDYLISNGLLKITDLLGREIENKKFKTNSVILEKGNLSSGVYLIELFDNNQFLGSKKLIIK